MQKIYKEININYEYYKNNSDTYMIFLHGWGQNIQMMMPLATQFLKKHNILVIDLPGFGESEEPKEVWEIFDYAELINEIVKELKIKNPILIGHSFGGKIAMSYSLRYEINKLVLL